MEFHCFIKDFKNIYVNSSCRDKTEDGNIGFIAIKTGVQEGCVISSFLFLLATDFIMKASLDLQEFGISWKGQRDLQTFTDGLSLLAECLTHLQIMATRLDEGAKKVGLIMQIGATKIITDQSLMSGRDWVKL